jgi:protein-tyrosine phosphatase
MIMDPSSHRLLLPNLYNARDMGGMITSSGKVTAFRRFIRSDSPAELDMASIDSLVEYSVRTVIDLRSEQEITRTGNPFMSRQDVAFFNFPLIALDPEDLRDPTMDFLVNNRLGDLYVMMLEHSRNSIRSVLSTILNAQEGVIMFHCLHGKDRTGLIAAILYLLAGVSRTNIIENYASSFNNIRPLVEPLFENSASETHHIYRSDAENMHILLDHIDKKYSGNVELYLREIGFSQSEIEKLRERMF